MKRLILIGCIVTVACYSCIMEEQAEVFGGHENIRVLMPSDKDTKVRLGDESAGRISQLWSPGDRIALVQDKGTEAQKISVYELVGDGGSVEGEFKHISGDADERGSVDIIYPVSSVNMNKVPALQTYVSGSYDPSSVLLSWHSDDGISENGVLLSNRTAILCLQYTGTSQQKVTSVRVKIYSSETMFEEYRVSDSEGVALSSEPKQFYLSVPEVTNGSKVVFEVILDDCSLMKVTSEDRVFSAGRIYRFSPIQFTADIKSDFYREPFQSVPSVDDMRIYSLSPRSFAKENAFQAVRARLDSIQMLNVNVIWILPTFLKSETRVPYGSPYSMRDFYQLDPEYGTVADLRALVDEAHSRGIAVILDLVTKHTGSDSEWLKTHPDWYKLKDTFAAPGFTAESFTDAADFDWTNEELQDELVKLMKYWIAVANIDGYRCDSASEVPLEVWSEAISTLRGALPDRKLIMLAEVAKADYLGSGFDLVYGWHFGATLEKVFSGEWTVNSIFTKNEEEMSSAAAFGEGKSRMRFSTNHDYAARNSPLTLYNSLDGANAAFVIALTMGGVPMIYASQEIAYPVKLSFFKNNAVVMDWDSNPEVFKTYCKFMEIAQDPVLRLGSLVRIENDGVVSFVREYGAQKILVLVNVTNKTTGFSLPEAYGGASYVDMMTSEDFTFNSTDLQPYQYYILKFK